MRILYFIGVLGCILLGTEKTQAQITGELNTPCNDDTNCWILGSRCINNVCLCEGPHIPNANNTRCAIATHGSCPSITSLCYDDNAACERGENTGIFMNYYCMCKSGFTWHGESDRCLVANGQPCSADLPCASDFCTLSNICGCPGFLIPNVNGTCNIALNGNCATVACADSNAFCSTQNICTCHADFQASSRPTELILQCRKRLNTDCLNGEDCASINADCVQNPRGYTPDKKCVCKEGFIPNDDRSECLKEQGIYGGACTFNRQCTSVFGPGSACTSSGCVCLDNFNYDSQYVSCMRN